MQRPRPASMQLEKYLDQNFCLAPITIRTISVEQSLRSVGLVLEHVAFRARNRPTDGPSPGTASTVETRRTEVLGAELGPWPRG